MKTFKWLTGILSGACLLAAASGCVKEFPVEGAPSEEPAGMMMLLSGDIVPFDVPTKGDGDFTFSDNNIIFLRLTDGTNTLLGKARYQGGSDEGQWFFSYTQGKIAGLTSGSVEAWLFETNWSMNNSNKVNLTYLVPVYRAVDGTFTVEGNTLSVNASFSPATGRINFTGDLEEGYAKSVRSIGGITRFKSFDPETFEITTESSVFSYGTMDSRNYVYGWFTAPCDPVLWYYDDADYIHVRHFPQEVLQTGKSSIIYVPDGNTPRAGWKLYRKNLNFYPSYTRIYLRFVGAGGFMLGGDDSGTAVLAGISEGFYMMDREVTRGLWRYATDDDAYGWDNIAVTGKTYDEIQSFIQQLNKKTGLSFRLPTEAEWEFAAKGGFWSKGYRYSGSDDVSVVAFTYTDDGTYTDDNPFQYWCQQKNANEITIRDMSGNVAELCSDWYSDYPDGAVQDYAGPDTGVFRVVRGGSAYSSPDRMTVTARGSEENYPADQVGFRLVMDAPLFAN